MSKSPVRRTKAQETGRPRGMWSQAMSYLPAGVRPYAPYVLAGGGILAGLVVINKLTKKSEPAPTLKPLARITNTQSTTIERATTSGIVEDGKDFLSKNKAFFGAAAGGAVAGGFLGYVTPGEDPVMCGAVGAGLAGVGYLIYEALREKKAETAAAKQVVDAERQGSTPGFATGKSGAPLRGQGRAQAPGTTGVGALEDRLEAASGHFARAVHATLPRAIVRPAPVLRGRALDVIFPSSAELERTQLTMDAATAAARAGVQLETPRQIGANVVRYHFVAGLAWDRPAPPRQFAVMHNAVRP